MKNEYDSLLEKAEHDFQAVKKLLIFDDSPTDVIAFHIQQMAEKLLKCLLIKNNSDYKFTHDLFYLLEKVVLIQPELKRYEELMEMLAPHAVFSRYEEGYEISYAEIDEILPQAEALRKSILDLLKD